MTKIKICGLTGVDDIRFVNEAGPDYVGFVFAKSKRRVSLEEAAFLKSLLAKEIKAVGVFVNESLDFIKKVCRGNIIDLIQLHGDEDEKYMSDLRAASSRPVIKAVRIKNKEDVVAAQADYSLFDTYDQDQYGGTGRRFDWELVKGFKKPFFLAGGLNLGNIKRALKVNPYCLDVSSGAETNGKKDKEKIVKIVNIVRSGI